MLGYYKNIKKTRVEINPTKKKRTRIKTRNDFTLEKFFENGKEYVRILHPSKTVEACLILCNKEPCKWWDDNGILPRHIRAWWGRKCFVTRKCRRYKLHYYGYEWKTIYTQNETQRYGFDSSLISSMDILAILFSLFVY